MVTVRHRLVHASVVAVMPSTLTVQTCLLCDVQLFQSQGGHIGRDSGTTGHGEGGSDAERDFEEWSKSLDHSLKLSFAEVEQMSVRRCVHRPGHVRCS